MKLIQCSGNCHLNKVLCIILLAFFIATAGCSEELHLKRYSNKTHGFVISVPKTWELKEDSAGLEVVAISPKEDDTDTFKENVGVYIEGLAAKIKSLEDYYEANIQEAFKVLTDFKIDYEGSEKINGHKSKYIIYSFRSLELNLKNVAYLFIHNDKGYAVTFSSTPKKFMLYKSKFEKIIKTFDLK